MKDKAAAGVMKGDFCDCRRDFGVLPACERRGILKTAKNLLKEQKKVKAMLANAGSAPLPMSAEKGGE